VGILVHLRTQEVQKQTQQILDFSLTLFISQDAVLHINLYTTLNTVLACIDCMFPLLVVFICCLVLFYLVLHYSFFLIRCIESYQRSL